jgi:hypothetical protein
LNHPNKIWKYVITDSDGEQFAMPFGAIFRHIDIDPDRKGPALWFQVDPDRARETRTFAVFATGEQVPVDFEYVGTVKDDRYIWHIFEICNRKVSA